ncbi:unnamed protein product [Hymenolepis diminuta]|uniref:DUF7041 domain-containing protein n=1 Tax=Hymenolepis diminuta TaxID=6216 RepID=A0A564Y2S9_HYMDI|nr:unnamed protein product [Hymenolepis diminuta]
MSNELEPVVNAVVAPITCSVFDPRNSYAWFRQLDNTFQLWGITQQKIMFQQAFSALPTDVAAEVIDIVDDTLKKVVIGRLSDSQEKRVQQLLLQVELGDRTPSQLLRHMRFLLGETRVGEVILRQLWMKCLPANMTKCLATSVNRGNLDELAETADKVQELSDRPCVQAVETPIPNRVTTQQPDVLTKLLEKLELLVPNISSQSGSKQRLRFSKQSDSSPIHRNQICFYHKMYGDDAKKCQPGCKYPKADTIISQGNFTGSNVSVIPRSAEKCFLQPTDPVLQATSNHLFNCHTSLYVIWTPINQDLNMTESLDLNCKQPSKIINSVTEFDTELFQTDIRELFQEFSEHADDSNLVRDDSYDFLPEHTATSRKSRGKRKRKTPKSTAVNQQKPSQSVTQHRNSKYQLLFSSKDAIQPSTPSRQSSPQDAVQSTTPPSWMSRSELSRTRASEELTSLLDWPIMYNN